MLVCVRVVVRFSLSVAQVELVRSLRLAQGLLTGSTFCAGNVLVSAYEEPALFQFSGAG